MISLIFSNPARSVWSVPSISEAVLGLYHKLFIDQVLDYIFYSNNKTTKTHSLHGLCSNHINFFTKFKYFRNVYYRHCLQILRDMHTAHHWPTTSDSALQCQASQEQTQKNFKIRGDQAVSVWETETTAEKYGMYPVRLS